MTQRGVLSTALLAVLMVSVLMASSVPAAAHESDAVAAGSGLGFGAAVVLTVALGVLGGVVVVRRRPVVRERLWTVLLSTVFVLLGGWAAIVAILQSPLLATTTVAVGGVAVWSARRRVVGGHCGCDHAALGAVVLHRFVEGVVLATVYAVNAALGLGAALVLGAHAAAETGAVAGLWATGRWRWRVVAIVQAAFVAGALVAGALATDVATVTLAASPLASTVLALVGGALIATGIATSTTHRDSPAQRHPA